MNLKVNKVYKIITSLFLIVGISLYFGYKKDTKTKERFQDQKSKAMNILGIVLTCTAGLAILYGLYDSYYTPISL